MYYIFFFAKFDVSGDGRVSIGELRGILSAANVTLSAEKIRDIVSAADADGSDSLDFEEFYGALRKQLGQAAARGDAVGGARFEGGTYCQDHCISGTWIRVKPLSVPESPPPRARYGATVEGADLRLRPLQHTPYVIFAWTEGSSQIAPRTFSNGVWPSCVLRVCAFVCAFISAFVCWFRGLFACVLFWVESLYEVCYKRSASVSKLGRSFVKNAALFAFAAPHPLGRRTTKVTVQSCAKVARAEPQASTSVSTGRKNARRPECHAGRNFELTKKFAMLQKLAMCVTVTSRARDRWERRRWPDYRQRMVEPSRSSAPGEQTHSPREAGDGRMCG